jgi:signal transduction histidine kinase
MEKHDGNPANQARRDKTDESLRLEREKADVAAEKKQNAIEADADEVVRSDRLRADQVLQAARDEADSGRSQPAASEQEQERRRADSVLEHERSAADAVLETERAVRRRYLAELLAGEREATDNDLQGEREDADAAFFNSEQLLAAVSHDLRSLLAGLSLSAQLLTKSAPEGTSGDGVRQYGGTSKRLVARMNRLVSDLVDLASIEAGKFAVVRQRVQLAEILTDAIDAFEPIAAANRIKLIVDAQGLPRHANIDGDRFLQVLGNLIGNAVKFTPAEGRITLAIRCEHDDIYITVSDTGIGIPDGALRTGSNDSVRSRRTGEGSGWACTFRSVSSRRMAARCPSKARSVSAPRSTSPCRARSSHDAGLLVMGSAGTDGSARSSSSRLDAQSRSATSRKGVRGQRIVNAVSSADDDTSHVPPCARAICITI